MWKAQKESELKLWTEVFFWLFLFRELSIRETEKSKRKDANAVSFDQERASKWVDIEYSERE